MYPHDDEYEEKEENVKSALILKYLHTSNKNICIYIVQIIREK